MNKRFNIFFIFFLCSISIHFDYCQENNSKKTTRKNNLNNKKKVRFDFTDKPLVDIINELAGEKKLNIILPQGTQAIATKITYKIPFILKI